MYYKDIYDNITFEDVWDVAIWGLDADSMEIFTQTVNARRRVKYFVDDNETYEGAPIFAKKIIYRGELLKNTSIYLLICRRHFEKEQEWIENNLTGRYRIIDIGFVNDVIRNSVNVYIYGAGDAGKRTLEILEEQKVLVEGFVDANSAKVGKYHCGYPIFDKVSLPQEAIVIISTVYFREVYKELIKIINSDHIYVDYRNCRKSTKSIKYGDMRSIFFELDEGTVPIMEIIHIEGTYTTVWNDFDVKKVILYGDNDLTQQVIEVLDLMDIDVAYVVDDAVEYETEGSYLIKNVYELAYEDMEDALVVVVKINEEKTKGRIVFDSGKALQEVGLTRFRQYRMLEDLRTATISGEMDLLLRYRNMYDVVDEKYPGFIVHGNEEMATKRVVVLGGSTTDYGFFEHLIKSWPEYLENKTTNVVIYNGGMRGYASAKECLKLLRDVAQLNPDLIVSYSGVNDANKRIEGKEKQEYPFGWSLQSNTCFGISNGKSKSDLWITMERYMQAISQVNGSKFISILQPQILTKKKLSAEEKRIRILWDEEWEKDNKYPVFVAEIREQMPKYDWMYDLTDAFDKIGESVYRDNCHLNNLGNQIIADKVYDIINDYYMKTENRKWLF